MRVDVPAPTVRTSTNGQARRGAGAARSRAATPLRLARCAFRGRTGRGRPGSAVPRSAASRAARPKGPRGCGWKVLNASGFEKPPEEALVDFTQRLDRAQIHVLVELVDRSVHRAELDHLA